MNSLAIVSGVCGGYGLWRLGRGLVPRREPLVEVLARAEGRMSPRPILRPSDARTAAAWLGRRAENAGRVLLPSVSADLRLVGKSLPQHAGEKVGLALAGLLLPAVWVAALAAVGVPPPVVPSAIVGVGMATAGFLIPDLAVRNQAATRRREFRHGQALYVWLVTSALAGGSGLDSALHDCAAVGFPRRDAAVEPGTSGSPGWVLRHIQAAVHRARMTRQPGWSGLRQLAGEVGVAELGEVATTTALAEVYGARARESLRAKAQSLSVRVRSELERLAHRGTDGMIGPVMCFVLGLLILFLYPLFVRLLTTHT